ncbi:MAG: hypothetical protein V4747_06800 [Pseudomonadota bacterium]
MARGNLIIPPTHAKVAADFNTLESSAAMDFTRVGRNFAHIIFWWGMFGVAFSLYQGFTAFNYPEEMMAQSKWVSREVGEALTLAFMGLVLGVLCEISAARRKSET